MKIRDAKVLYKEELYKEELYGEVPHR